MISAEQVKALREKTGLSVMQCMKALEEAGGDEEKAIIILRKSSAAIADKKSERTLGSGVIASYIHGTGSVGAIVELSCETDFVAKSQDFQDLSVSEIWLIWISLILSNISAKTKKQKK